MSSGSIPGPFMQNMDNGWFASMIVFIYCDSVFLYFYGSEININLKSEITYSCQNLVFFLVSCSSPITATQIIENNSDKRYTLSNVREGHDMTPDTP